MADTGQKNYSVVEAVNRILRALLGSANSTDAPGTLSGVVYSINGALSKLAELFEGNDAGETLTIPNANFGTITTTSKIDGNDLELSDWATVRGITATEINAGTGTFYAGYGQSSIGGFSDDALFGKGEICLGFGPSSTIPSGTLTHLGGVLFAEGGALKWLGSSGTVTTLAGS
jgi:hypothetical protein